MNAVPATEVTEPISAATNPRDAAASSPTATELVAELMRKARAAQREFEQWSQERIDEVVTAAAWAIVEPGRNRELAELSVADTGLGNVADKVTKNRRKTLGLLRDLRGLKTAGVIAELPELGLVEIARPVGVVAAVTPSTNPAATPANKVINSLKCRNAVIVSPSPKGYSTCERLVGYIHAELDRVGAPRDLVQHLPTPVTKESSAELMRQADLIVATGSLNNVRGAYASGTPAFGVGAGNVVVIVDETADLARAAGRIAASKTFDNATSCSSENSLVAVEAIYPALLAALENEGAVLLNADEKKRLQATMWPKMGKLGAATTAKDAATIARLAGLDRPEFAKARILIVEETGVGPGYPFSGEKLSPVLTLYRVPDFDRAVALCHEIFAYQGAGHSVGIQSQNDERILRLGLELPVCRVIVNQAHCFATGGSFDNGLPFSLSMGCGTWGRNNFSENMHWRHYVNITRIARPIPPREVSEEEMFAAYRKKFRV